MCAHLVRLIQLPKQLQRGSRRHSRALILQLLCPHSFVHHTQPVIVDSQVLPCPRKIELTEKIAESPEAAEASRAVFAEITFDVDIALVSSVTGEGLEKIRAYARPHTTIAFIGASGVGKSTLVNALVGHEVQRTAEVREDDQRGRQTTVAAELIALPGDAWLLDTPGLRAVTLWTSSNGIERAFPDVFDLAGSCRFRDCKHQDEPGCAVTEAIAAGSLPAIRLESMRRLVAEELNVEEEQTERERQENRRGFRKAPKPTE